jgi:hypothetical protein
MGMGYEDYDFKKFKQDELVKFIEDIFDINEVTDAIRELYNRNANLAMDLSKNILENSLGDRYLQASIIDFIFWKDEKQYILMFTKNNLNTLDYCLYAEILDCITAESLQPFGQSLSRDFLQDLLKKYGEYNTDEQAKIAYEFDWFKDSYKEMFI